MIIELVKQWEENKYRLEAYFRNKNQSEYSSYEFILRKIFELCIPNTPNNRDWDLDKMTVIDDGEYSGTKIFIIPYNVYEPDIKDYVMTDTYYGSCSGCDTLMNIADYEYGLPNDRQVREYMTLALHLVQKLRGLGIEED